jgi:hypothetical protein
MSTKRIWRKLSRLPLKSRCMGVASFAVSIVLNTMLQFNCIEPAVPRTRGLKPGAVRPIPKATNVKNGPKLEGRREYRQF